MSNPADGTLPNIKNASRLTLQLMALKPGEFIDVTRSQLPSSYRGIGSLTGRISRAYSNIFFAVLALEAGPGWRIIRVNNLAEVKTLIGLHPKAKKMENEEPKPNNTFSDADLAQMIDAKIVFARRDIADLTPRGVTATRLDDLEAANEAFKIMPSDTELKGEVSGAGDQRNDSRAVLESRIGNVRTMAQNKFGHPGTVYNSFGFKGMVSLDDNDLSRVSKIVNKQTIKYAAELASEGCDAAFLTALQDEVDDFDGKIDVVKLKDKARQEGTANRTTAGNTNYTEVEKICNTAKDVYRESDPTRHDDYLIYPSSGGSVVVEGDLSTAGEIVVITTPPGLTIAAGTQIKLEMTGGPGRAYFASAAGNPLEPAEPFIDVAGGAATTAAAGTGMGFVPPGRIILQILNTGTGAAHYKFTFL